MDYRCKPLEKGKSYCVTVPGSKSITNRALLLGALAEGKTTIRGVLFSEDSRVFMKALEEIGFSVKIEEEKKEVEIEGLGGCVPTGPERRIYVGKRRDSSEIFDSDACLVRTVLFGGIVGTDEGQANGATFAGTGRVGRDI